VEQMLLILLHNLQPIQLQHNNQQQHHLLLSNLKSPYFLMIGFSALMMFTMKQVPKEEMEAYQEQQGEQMK
jgi:hypothetical protein